MVPFRTTSMPCAGEREELTGRKETDIPVGEKKSHTKGNRRNEVEKSWNSGTRWCNVGAGRERKYTALFCDTLLCECWSNVRRGNVANLTTYIGHNDAVRVANAYAHVRAIGK